MTALNPHALEWPVVFQYEEYLLRKAIPLAGLSIEHIGSTAVQTLYARPIIDIMIGIPPGYSLEVAREPLLQLGYNGVRCQDAFSPQLFFVRKENHHPRLAVSEDELERTQPTHHVHVVQLNGSFWNHSLRIRDHLRQNSEDKRVYEIIKKHLANSVPAKMDKYEKLKLNFINSIVA